MTSVTRRPSSSAAASDWSQKIPSEAVWSSVEEDGV
jgi:hypothetical protein